MKIAATTFALAAALSLAACADADETAYSDGVDTGETTVITNEVPVEVPADGTVNTTTDEGSRLTIDGKDVDATISNDGVKADIKVDGD